MVDYLIKVSSLYYGLSVVELKKLAYEFARKVGAKYPKQWDEHLMAGKDWYIAFMKRHSYLSLRTPEQTSLNGDKGFCKENVETFFQNLDRITTETKFEIRSIWNMDESGFPTVATKTERVIARSELRAKRMKRDERNKSKETKKQVSVKRKSSKGPKSQPPKKRNKPVSSLSSSEEDFCILCLEAMPKKLTKYNSIACNVCKRNVHLKCAKMTASYYTCPNCNSDDEEEQFDEPSE